MKLFVASSFLNKVAAHDVEEQLKSAGHEITSVWVNNPQSFDHKVLAAESVIDAIGIEAAEGFVLLKPWRLSSSTEFGMAIAWGKHIFVVGISDPLEVDNLYLHYPKADIYFFKDIQDLIHFLALLEFDEVVGWIPAEEEYGKR